MVYKQLGKTGLNVSRLGFGAMRLPSSASGKADAEESVRILHRAFELGVNYVDTAVIYCNFESQAIVGQALKGWRDKVCVSTKNHYHGPDERLWRRNLDDSLRLLDVDYIDVYNIHGINWKLYEERLKGPGGVVAWMRKARDEGLIKHICCSFHDGPDALRKIAETGDFSAITLQYNLLYRDLEPVFPEIAARNIGIVVMGPVGGGRLGMHSEQIAGMVEGAASTPEVALRFVLDNPHVTTAISGMSDMRQVEENCAVADREEPLTEAERNQINLTLDKLKGLAELYCTGCNYCMPCPHGVDIPANFLAINEQRVYGLAKPAKDRYDRTAGKATYCVACGACEPKCPQNIPIRAQLREAAAMFDEAYGAMALRLEPVRWTEGALEFRAQLHNISDKTNQAAVTFDSGHAAQIDPAELNISIDKPFAAKTCPITLQLADGLPHRADIAAQIQDDAGQRRQSFGFALGRCHSAGDLNAFWSRVAGLDPISINAAAQVAKPKDSPRPLFNVQAWPAYTADEFALCVRVLDKDAPPENRLDGRLPWRLDVLLDFRKRDAALAPAMQNGMFLVRIVPQADAEPAATIAHGSLDAARLKLSCSTIEEGAEVRLAVPWNALADAADGKTAEHKPGEAIGFDLAVWCGEFFLPTYRALWTGDTPGTRTPPMGALFFE